MADDSATEMLGWGLFDGKLNVYSMVVESEFKGICCKDTGRERKLKTRGTDRADWLYGCVFS